MKQLILLAIFCATSLIAKDISGQSTEYATADETMQAYLSNFEKDDKRKYHIQEIVMSDGQSKEQLFDALRVWMAEHFEDEGFALEADDMEAGILVGRGWTYLGITPDWSAVKMHYSIRIEVRDGKYRFRIFQVEFDNHTTDDNRVGMSRLTDKVSEAYHENGHIELGAEYTFAVDALQAIIDSKESLMSLDIDIADAGSFR